jgi:hypothetical protein
MRQKWSDRLQPLVGRTIRRVRYLNDEEQSNVGWDRSAVMIELDDGALLFPSQDDEGNGPGALFIQPGTKTQTLPEGGAPII